MSKEIDNSKTIDKAEKILIGIQLICENVDDVVKSDLTTKTVKYKLKNLAIQSRKFEQMFWSNLDNEEAELEFQNKMSVVESSFEKIH